MNQEKEQKKSWSPSFKYNTNPEPLNEEQEKIVQLLHLTAIKLFGKADALFGIHLLKPNLIHALFEMLAMDLEKAQKSLHLFLGHETLPTPQAFTLSLDVPIEKVIAGLTKTSADIKKVADAYQAINTFITLYLQDKENIATLIKNLSSHDNNNDNNNDVVSEEVYCPFN